MMGTKQRNVIPLIHVSLENLVPKDHFYRQLDEKLDLSFMYEFVQASYAQGGRPSIDPIVFFKLQLVMFFDGVRSENVKYQAERASCPGPGVVRQALANGSHFS
jgi:transposase